MENGPSEVTRLLAAHRGGDFDALERLLPIVYAELKRLAAGRLRRERPGHTLQPTALVHEAYIRLAGGGPRFENRAHFFGIAARVMRQVLVDHARASGREKRGGDRVRVTLRDEAVGAGEREFDLVALDEALERLAARDAGAAHVVELRYFAGLSIEETAEALGISPATVKRDWAVAKAFLRRELE